MFKKSLMIALAGISMLGASPVVAQGIGHTFFMRGSIVGADTAGTIVCIGRADGAEVGQSLEVYRMVPVPGPNKGAGSPFRRQLIGHVQIDHIYDEHFAHVTIQDGRPKKNDVVELRRN
jgi:hypothetical protein